jgi:toxin ParE1/3/4
VRDFEWYEMTRADLLATVDRTADANPDSAQRLKDDIEAKAAELAQFSKDLP